MRRTVYTPNKPPREVTLPEVLIGLAVLLVLGGVATYFVFQQESGVTRTEDLPNNYRVIVQDSNGKNVHDSASDGKINIHWGH